MSATETLTENKTEISVDFLRSELSAAFVRVWEASLSMPLDPIDTAMSDKSSFPWLGVEAWIGGSWTGNVRLGFPKELAFVITSRLLEVEAPTNEQIQDALRELVNMTAGNLKPALPGRCGLAIPGNFEISSLNEVRDVFSPILLTWYKTGPFAFFLSLSAFRSS